MKTTNNRVVQIFIIILSFTGIITGVCCMGLGNTFFNISVIVCFLSLIFSKFISNGLCKIVEWDNIDYNKLKNPDKLFEEYIKLKEKEALIELKDFESKLFVGIDNELRQF